MKTKLVQKHLIKGTQDFEIIDDQVIVRYKAPFKKEEVLSVSLTVLDPEPVISQSYLHFNSRVNGEALLSLYLGKPNTGAFNDFVAVLKQKAREEFDAFAGLKNAGKSSAMSANVYDEPPDFDTEDDGTKYQKGLDSDQIKQSIQMLKQYLNEEEIADLISALEALSDKPDDEGLQMQLVEAFNKLGPMQGAVLTYAPYINILLSDDPFSGF